MADMFLEWGGDLGVSASGDLKLVSGNRATDQRIVRRLLTNAGDYVWHSTYGGSLAMAVGAPVQARRIEAIIRAQLLMEAAVPVSPVPSVDVRGVDATSGSFVVDIRYGDAGIDGGVAVSVSQDVQQ